MQDTSWTRPFHLLKAGYGWDVWHRVVSTRNDNGIKPLSPPVVLTGSLFAQGDLPFRTNLLYSLDRRVVRDQVAIAPPRSETVNVPSHDVPVPKRRVMAMQLDGALTLLVRNRLIGELHRYVVNVGLEVRVHGRLGKARLIRLGRKGRQCFRNSQWSIGRSVGESRKVEHCRRSLRVSEPECFVSCVVRTGTGLAGAAYTSTLPGPRGVQRHG